MRALPPWTFPGSRVLAGWRRQLAPVAPSSFWVAHLPFHHVEAPVVAVRSLPLDRFHQLVLQAIQQNPAADAARLDEQIHLGTQFIWQILHKLQAEGFVEKSAAGEWCLSSLGRESLDRGASLKKQLERRLFHFTADPRTGRAASFVHLHEPLCEPGLPAEDWRFDPALLQACLHQAAAWKEVHGFPLDVLAVADEGEAANQDQGSESIDRTDPNAPPQLAPWQRVIYNRSERLGLVFVRTRTEAGGDRLLGFSFEPGSWRLQMETPTVVLEADGKDVFPELAEEPTPDALREAWRGWCRPRSVPPSEVDACSLEYRDRGILVSAPRKLAERLRAARSDIFKGEAWLLVGSSSVRLASLLQLETEQK